MFVRSLSRALIVRRRNHHGRGTGITGTTGTTPIAAQRRCTNMTILPGNIHHDNDNDENNVRLFHTTPRTTTSMTTAMMTAMMTTMTTKTTTTTTTTTTGTMSLQDNGSVSTNIRTSTRPFSTTKIPSKNQPHDGTRTTMNTIDESTATSSRNKTTTAGRKLNALEMSVVRQIKAELMEVDENSDGRLQAEELKKLLQKHSDAFTEEECQDISELYYAAKAGGAVSFDNFIEAIDYAASISGEEFPFPTDPNNDGNDDRKREEAGKKRRDDHWPGNDLRGDHNNRNSNDWRQPGKVKHFKETGRHPLGVGREMMEYYQSGHPHHHHGHYTKEELDVKLTHVPPKVHVDRLALWTVRIVRLLFDSATGWRNDRNITVRNVLNRVIYLETIAAVPGMVAAIIRHFKSLRTMSPDGGLLQMFLEEANNERMHLLTFVRMKNPGTFFRVCVIVGQFGFGTFFTVAYLLSPKYCHRFVGYVEEEACLTYTKIIKAIEDAPDGTDLAQWRTDPAPDIAKAYWKLGETGTVLDLMYAVRADEAEHRDVNHLVSGLKEGQFNPLYDPQSKLDMMLVRYVQDIMSKSGDFQSVPPKSP